MAGFLAGFAARFRRRNDPADRQGTLDELHKLRATKQRDDRYTANPNDGYATPFDGGQYPGINPGGPY